MSGNMKIDITPDGFIAGGWRFTDGAWIWVGTRYMQTHYARSEAQLLRHHGEAYVDERLDPERQEVVSEILRGLGR